MDGICNRLLNVKGMVVEDACIVDSPLRPVPVLEIRPRPRGACSGAPDAADAVMVTTGAAACVAGDTRTSAAGGSDWSPPCRAWTARNAASWSPPCRGRAGQPVHQGFRGGVRVADDGREPEDGRRFPSYRVEDRGRRRPSGRRTRQGVDALAVRRPDGDRRGRDQLQEGPRTWPWSSTTSGIG